MEEIDEADVTYQDEGQDAKEEEQTETATPLSEEVEDLKKAALELNRDLLILEEELLFPANSQIVVFVSLDVGKYFALDSVKLLIDDKLIASHLYTRRQNAALTLGGIQRLYLGNLKSGEHEVTAFFVGMGPDNREYKRGATIIIDKDDDPKLLELKVRDSSANMQPEFEFEEWQL
ncbi:MAG: AraC family transcriptional regulator [Agarilytica sp.]